MPKPNVVAIGAPSSARSPPSAPSMEGVPTVSEIMEHEVNLELLHDLRNEIALLGSKLQTHIDRSSTAISDLTNELALLRENISDKEDSRGLATVGTGGGQASYGIGGVRTCDAIRFGQGLNLLALRSLPLQHELRHFQHVGHKCIRVCCLTHLFISLLVFVFWGCYKLYQDVFCGDVVCDYVDIRHEKMVSKPGDMQVPKTLCIAGTTAQTQVEAISCEIPHGNGKQRRKRVVPLIARSVVRAQGSEINATCLAERPPIQGAYGDPMYKFVQINLFVTNSTESTKEEKFAANLLVESKVGGKAKFNETVYYTFLNHAWTGVEVFLSRRTTIEGDSLGLSRILPHTYKKIYGEEGVGVESVYTRMHDEWNTSSIRKEYATFYIRAASFAYENTYEPYGLLKLLQESGGLWTGLSSLVAALVFTVFCSCRVGCRSEMARKCTRING